MNNQALAKVEQAGRDFFHNNPNSTYVVAERTARKEYAAVIEHELFVAGWNHANWDEIGHALKAED